MGAAKAAEAPLPTGRLLTYQDITPAMKGRQAEVTDSTGWYHVLLHHASS